MGYNIKLKSRNLIYILLIPQWLLSQIASFLWDQQDVNA